MKDDTVIEDLPKKKNKEHQNQNYHPVEIKLTEEEKKSKTIKLSPSKKEIKKEQEQKEKRKNIVKELIPYIVILLVVVLIRTFLFTPVIVSGPSMKPTFKGGEILILNKLSDYDRFDVVVVKVKREGRPKEEIIKRIIALPGETIVCENGIIYVNGIRQDEKYSMGNTYDFDLVKLGEDEYFVMGDNREDSADSRIFGPFKEKEIKGTTDLVIFPFNHIGKVK